MHLLLPKGRADWIALVVVAALFVAVMLMAGGQAYP